MTLTFFDLYTFPIIRCMLIDGLISFFFGSLIGEVERKGKWFKIKGDLKFQSKRKNHHVCF